MSKVYHNPHPKGWGYTDEARLRGLIHTNLIQNPVVKVYHNPHPKGWGYTDEARLRGLIQKIDLRQST